MSKIHDIKTFTKYDVILWNSVNRYGNKGLNLICGTKDSKKGAVFVGDIEGSGNLHEIVVPGTEKDFSTQVTFGEYIGKHQVSLVGKLVSDKGLIKGFKYSGKLNENDLNDSSNYKIFGIGEKITVPLGVSQNITVGISSDNSKIENSDFVNGPLGGYIYNVKTEKKIFISHDHFKTLTATGIVHSHDNVYVICGSASEKEIVTNIDTIGLIGSIIGKPYLVDYDSKTNKFTNWKFFGTNERRYSEHHELFSGECKLSSFSSISKNCDNNFQVIANIIHGNSSDHKSSPYEVESYWGEIRREKCDKFFDNNFVLISEGSRLEHRDDFCGNRKFEYRRNIIATGVYHDKFVGIRIKEKESCKDIRDDFSGFQGKFHVIVPCCVCTCQRLFKWNYITECWMNGNNRNPYDLNCFYDECNRITPFGTIPIVPPESIFMTGPVVCPDPTNPSIVPVVGPEVPLFENLVSDENAWGPHDIRWKLDGPWNKCGCGWIKDIDCGFDEPGCTKLAYPGEYSWRNCGNMCCWNNTPCRNPNEWLFERCSIHSCAEFKKVFAIAFKKIEKLGMIAF